MTGEAADADVLRRHFVAIATSAYDDPTWEPLEVAEEVQVLSEWLCTPKLGDRHFRPDHPNLAASPTKTAIRDALENPPYSTRWRAADAAVVFVTGHGTTGHGSHWMVLQATEAGRLHSTALRTADLVGWLYETDIQHLFLVLDMCFAGRTIEETAAFDRDIPKTWLVLPSATKDQEAVTGALTTAIGSFLNELESPIGEKYGLLDPLLDVTEFLDGVEQKLGPGQRLIPLQGSQRSGRHPCLPNPHYRPDASAPVSAQRSDLALPQQEFLTHWEPRSRGVVKSDEQGWLFNGREQLMRRLIAATTAAPGTVLVTGCAGSGKSAVLARLVTLSDPLFLERYRDRVADIRADLKPARGAVDVAVLATGKSSHEVIAQICQALRVPRPDIANTVPPLEDWIHAWQAWLACRITPVTVVVDALDEASDPPDLLAGVLARLDAHDASQRRVRLLIGVRSPGGTDLTVPTAGVRGLPLADQAEKQLVAQRIRVDEPPWWCEGDVANYATKILRLVPGSPYADFDGRPLAPAVAGVLAANAGTSFLIARIAATSLAHRPTVVDPCDAHWLRAVNDGVLGVFRDDLHTTLADADDRLRAVHLLRAVAFAYGRGLPWGQIWPAVANAVAPERAYGDSDIAWLLGSRLGAYLVTDREDDVTVYRLFHDALRTTLRERWRELLDPGGAA